MVKFGKKFFFNEEEEKKQTPKRNEKKKVVKKRDNKLIFEKIKYYSKRLIPFILILAIILGLLFLIKSCSNSNKKSKNNSNSNEVEKINPKIIDTIRIKIGEEVPTIDKFVRNYSKVKTDRDQIIYEDANFTNKTYTQVGEYKVTIIINDTEYKARIIVRDEDAPALTLKGVTINEGSTYAITDFVESCTDNSNKACTYEYVDQAYGKYTSAGTYEIKIIASDTSGNKTEAKSSTLTIIAKQTPTPKPTPKPTPQTCSYGKDTVRSGEVVSYYVSSNGCAVNKEYAKTSKYIDTPKNMAFNDKKKLEDQMRAKNYQGSVKFDLSVTPVLNTTENGLVGYKVVIVGTETSNNSVIVKYAIRSNGTRAYEVNALNLP